MRDYLFSTLRDLGVEVRVEQSTARPTAGRFVRARSVQNIIGTVRGTNNHRAVMLMAHYDSVPAGPGAADDGAGVCSILEVLRAVRAGPPLRNDLVVLLTDGEEAGLLGASAFVADHPHLASQVAIVMNLEARGSSGPALMFETSDHNGWLIAEFARAAPYPIASSLMYSVYKLLPNDTDLTELKKTGVGALNFAFTETVRNYHSAADSIANLDPRSVQHMGMNALALARHFGDLSLSEVRKPDCIYFNWVGHRLFFYPLWVAWILELATFVLLGFTLFSAHQRGLPEPGIIASLGAFFLLLFAVGGGMVLAWNGIRLVLGHSLGRGDTVDNRLFFAGFAALGFVIGAMILCRLSRNLGRGTFSGGLLLVPALLAAIVLFLLPGASYVLQWPALLGTVAFLLSLRASTPAVRAGWGLVAGLPLLLLFAPLADLFFVNLGLNDLSLGATALLLSLLLAAAWPVFDFLFRAGTAVRN